MFGNEYMSPVAYYFVHKHMLFVRGMS